MAYTQFTHLPIPFESERHHAPHHYQPEPGKEYYTTHVEYEPVEHTQKYIDYKPLKHTTTHIDYEPVTYTTKHVDMPVTTAVSHQYGHHGEEDHHGMLGGDGHDL